LARVIYDLLWKYAGAPLHRESTASATPLMHLIIFTAAVKNTLHFALGKNFINSGALNKTRSFLPSAILRPE